MNYEPKILRERKQSLNRATESASAKEIKQRSSSSVPKKTSTNAKLSPPQQGSYLLGWGQLPTG